jgi:serine/threonine protein kinase
LSLSLDPRIGSELVGYRLDALVGRGGMGVVYKAYDRRLKRYVALKLIAPELSEDGRFRERFLAESELAASLDHPNVVPIYDAFDADGRLAIAQRYVDGTDLKLLLRQEHRLDGNRALRICSQVAAALDVAHARGLVHRDVKPSNVLLDENEHVYLADFGLSRRLADLAGSGEEMLSVGTPDYASPEQIEQRPVDGRADQYALACLLYECLTGEPPFRRDSELATLWAHVQEPPSPATERTPELRPEVDPVLAKGMAKSPADRYGSCRELLEAAGEALGMPRVANRRRRFLAVALSALVVTAAVLVPLLLLTEGTSAPSRPSTTPTLTPQVDSVQRVDPKANSVVATIPGGAGTGAIAVGDGAVFVASSADRTVSRIDPATNAVVRRTATDAPPTNLGFGYQYPNGLDPVLWVSSADSSKPPLGSEPCTLSQLDARTLAKHFTTSYGAPPPACGSVASRDGQTWFGGSWLALVRVDPTSGTALRTIPVGNVTNDSDSGHGLAVGAGAVWLPSPFTEELLRFDDRGKRAIAIGAGSLPIDVAVGLGRVWVVDNARHAVVDIDPGRNRIVRRIPVSGDPIAVAVGAGAVWVANNEAGTLSRIDPRSGHVTTFKVGPHPRNVVFGEGGVWVTVHPS